jgi:hypothetical protein
MPSETTDHVYLQLWPDWSPSRAESVVRFPVLVKLGTGARVDPAATIEIRLRDRDGEVLGVETTTLGPAANPIEGPAWRELPGRLLTIPDAVASAEVALGDAVSARAPRDEIALPVLLVPVERDLGLAGEPHLWWCYRNQGEAAVVVADVLRDTVLWVDDDATRPPAGPYNGPTRLPRGRALSGWWSLDDFPPVDRRRPHRFALAVQGERSRPFTFAW